MAAAAVAPVAGGGASAAPPPLPAAVRAAEVARGMEVAKAIMSRGTVEFVSEVEVCTLLRA